MKSLLLLLFVMLISSNLFAGELRSLDARREICYTAFDIFEIDVFTRSGDRYVQNCIQSSKMTVLNTFKDEKTNKINHLLVRATVGHRNLNVTFVSHLTLKKRDGELVWVTKNYEVKSFGDGLSTEEFLEDISEDAMVHNGDVRIERFNPKKFNSDKEYTKLEKDLPDEGSCQYANFDYAFEEITEEVERIERKLKQKGIFFKRISRTYEDGESEYCSHFYYYIYTTDGFILKLYYDYTT